MFLQAEGSTNDHDLGLFQIGAGAGPSEAGRRTVGLYHLAWEVDTLAELSRIRDALLRRGPSSAPPTTPPPRRSTPQDPDGLEFEVSWLLPADLITPDVAEGAATTRRWTSTARSRATAPRPAAASGSPSPPEQSVAARPARSTGWNRSNPSTLAAGPCGCAPGAPTTRMPRWSAAGPRHPALERGLGADAGGRRRLARAAAGVGGDHASWAVEDAATGSSWVGLPALDRPGADDAEIGYWTAPAARGRGVASARRRRGQPLGVRTLPVDRIELCHAVENVASGRVAEKAGFIYEGHLRRSFRYGDGVKHDELLWARLATTRRRRSAPAADRRRGERVDLRPVHAVGGDDRQSFAGPVLEAADHLPDAETQLASASAARVAPLQPGPSSR